MRVLAALLTASLCFASEADVASFEFVFQTIRDKHWDRELVAKPWQKTHDELLPKVRAAKSPEEARELMNQMIATLKMSHFGVFPKDIYADQAERGEADAGIDLRVVEGKALVTKSRDPRVHTGWEILAVQGKDVAPVIAQVFSPLARIRMILARLNGKPDSTVKVKFAEGEIELTRKLPAGNRVVFSYLPPFYVDFETRKPAPDAGYFRLNSFFDVERVMSAFADSVQSCNGCAGMVIDLRGNPGGIGGMAMGMAGWFVGNSGKQLGKMLMQGSTLNFVINPRVQSFQGKVAILVDEASGSTSEIFAGGLKDIGRARIFGTRTAGAALPSVFERLPNGDGFQYAIANYISFGGKPLEGEGVVPDVSVPLARAALLAGKDEALEAALQWIHGK